FASACCGDRSNLRSDVLSRLVLDGCVREVVLSRVSELDVANRPRGTLDLSSDALVAFGAETRRPFHGFADSDRLFPIAAHADEVVGEDCSCPAPIRAVDDGDVLVGEADPLVAGGNA